MKRPDERDRPASDDRPREPSPARLADALRGAFLDEVGLRDAAAGGRTIGPYLLLSPLGRGASGTVWRALHRELLHEVAIKLLDMRGDEAGAGERLERFRREAATAARLRHPGIVTVHDFGHDESSWYLVMDLVEGLPLDRWFEQERPTVARRLAVVEQVARAADHAHRHGVVHRDLKPSNIMVRHGDEAVLVDFGVARDRSDRSLTKVGGVVGTFAFMAPEQLDGAREPDARSDLFSLGVLLQFVVTGRPVFVHAASPADALAARKTPRLLPSQFAPSLTPEFDSLVARCLEPDPARRLGDAGVLADELARLRREAVPAAKSTRLQRWRSVVTSFAVLAVLVAGVLAAEHLLEQRRSLTSHARALAIESALLELSPQLRRPLARAEAARYTPLPESENLRLSAEIEAILAASGDTTGVAAAYHAWSEFLLAPDQAADAFARAKRRHPDNPFVWLLSARRQLRRAADSPAWSTALPISYELLIEPLAAPGTLHQQPAMRTILADARDDLEQARRTAVVEALPGLEWIVRLCEGLERFSAGDPEGVVERLDPLCAHGDIDFEATLFLCLARFDQRRVSEALDRARALHQQHPGVKPATKLLALCLQVEARDQLDVGKSPLQLLEEAKVLLAQAGSESLVDAILVAQLDFDLECARLYAGITSETAWRAIVAQWIALRARILAQESVEESARGAAHARVGWARNNLALATLHGQAAIDEQQRAADDYREAARLARKQALVRVQEVQARLMVAELRARWGAPIDPTEVDSLKVSIAELRQLAAPDESHPKGNPWALAQAEIAEAQLTLCEVATTPQVDAAFGSRCREAAAQARHARALAPQIGTTTFYEFDAELWARVAEAQPAAAIAAFTRQLPFESLGDGPQWSRWIEPLFVLANDVRCDNRLALLDAADAAIARMQRAVPDSSVFPVAAVEALLRRRWLDPTNAIAPIEAALAHASAALDRDPTARTFAEAKAFALLMLAELGGSVARDYDECLAQAEQALAVACREQVSVRAQLLRARLAVERGDAAAAAEAKAQLDVAIARDLESAYAARSWVDVIQPRLDHADDQALAAVWRSLLP